MAYSKPTRDTNVALSVPVTIAQNIKQHYFEPGLDPESPLLKGMLGSVLIAAALIIPAAAAQWIGMMGVMRVFGTGALVIGYGGAFILLAVHLVFGTIGYTLDTYRFLVKVYRWVAEHISAE